MNKAPKVTVLIPVFNGARYLEECVDGILNQTFTDFEILLIDDGSTDGSLALARRFTDPRIRLVENGRNLGGPTTRNRGFDLARGEYVAFMDCDDVSVPDRLAKQVAFMDAHPEVGICGSFMQVMHADGTLKAGAVYRCPTDHERIARYLAIDCTLFNPTLMTRRSVVTANALYHDPAYTTADDMDWYIRMARVTRLANLPEVLTFYRNHAQQETRRLKFLSRRNTINLHLGLVLEEIRKFRPEVEGKVEPVTGAMTDLTFIRNLVLVDRLMAGWPAPGAASAEEFQVYHTLKKHLNLMWRDTASSLPRYSLPVYRAVKQSAFFQSLPLAVRLGIWCRSVLALERPLTRRTPKLPA